MNPNYQGPSSSRAEYGETRPLNLDRKIFLSHSGRDKNFVRFLHDKLCRQYHDVRFVFFDEDSLPTAEPITMENILSEARGCELGVLVLSDDFFTHSPNPMLELEALTASEVQLLPLFYKISVDGFNKMRNQSTWEERWKEWSGLGEERIQVWRRTLRFVNRYSGLEYCKLATNELEYIGLIVKAVTRIIRPAISFIEEGVYGMDRLCKIVDCMYKDCASKRSSDVFTLVASTCGSVGQAEDGAGAALDLVGIYGFAGLGKTMLCKSLCDFYFAEFHGKVCWIDLGSLPSDPASSQTHSSTAFAGRIHYLLSKLVGNIDGAHSLTFPQVKNLLRNQICYRREPLFLAIDNILPDPESLDEGHFYLSCKLPKGSKIFITSRNENILEVVIREHTRFSVMLRHIPTLQLEEARNIFMHKIPKLMITNRENEVKACVRMCCICIDNGEWYHPLMLISLAASIRHDRRCNVDWKRRLRELQLAAALDKTDAWNRVFKVLDITYEVLSKEAQQVFLDLALFNRTFSKANLWKRCCSGYAWIQCVYSHCDKERLDKILLSLEDTAFICWKYGSEIQMHDLMVDFSIYKLLEDAVGFNQHYLVLNNGSHLQNPAFSFLLANAIKNNEWPTSSSSKSVRTVSISGCSEPEMELDLRNLEGLEVLHLVDNAGVQEVLLSPTSVAHLRSFIVRVPPGRPSLCCTMYEAWSSSTTAHKQMPGGQQLVWVELEGNVILATCRKGRSWLSNNLFPQSLQSWWQRFNNSTSTAARVFELGSWSFLRNLQYLTLSRFPAQSINLLTCSNLKRLALKSMPSLTHIHGLEKLTKLDELDVFDCQELVEISMPATRRLHSWVNYCPSLERISLHIMPYSVTEADCTRYGGVYLRSCSALRFVDGITQYTGTFEHRNYGAEKRGNMQEAMQVLVGSIETDSSKFKATVKNLLLNECNPVPGLAGVVEVNVRDVQHAALLISALCKVQAASLRSLGIRCKADGDCGCDKNVPQFDSWPGPKARLTDKGFSFDYHCPQVRDLASLALVGNGLDHLNLSGCRSVEVWPNFTTMTSIRQLDLSYTSLEEWPMGVQLLPFLARLDIRGCRHLPEKEMIKVITCKPQPGYSVCSRDSLASLYADLKDCRRDRGSVADALDSYWPDLVALLHEQWRYLRNPTMYPGHSTIHGAELCFLIMLMYDVWFGEVEAMSHVTDSIESDGPLATTRKMRRLLCSEIFMSLPFYIWRIGRTRVHALDEWEDCPGGEGCESYMALALIGSASIGYFNASVNDDLKDRIVNFLQSFVEAPQRVGDEVETPQATPIISIGCLKTGFGHLGLSRDAHEMLAMRVGNAVCKMVRVPSVVAALGQDFMGVTMDGLKASYKPRDPREFHKRAGLWGECRIVTCIVEPRAPSVVAELGEEFMRTTMDCLGARVLCKVMLKIFPFSILMHMADPIPNEKPRKLVKACFMFQDPTLNAYGYSQEVRSHFPNREREPILHIFPQL